jgi:DNA-binding NarL/FixJ family response regulator
MGAMRLLLIEDDVNCGAHIQQRVRSWQPDAEVTVRSAGCDGPLPPELLAQGFDAVLLTDSPGGTGLEWAKQLARREGFAPLVVICSSRSDAAIYEAVELGVAVLPRADVARERFFHVLTAAQQRQAAARGEWRTGVAGRQAQSFGGVFIRGYRHIRRLATGKVADLYLAESERAGELVALKVARDSSGERKDVGDPFRRFLQEYEIGQHIQARSVVRLLELGVSDEHAWLVMEYFPCGDLRARIRAGVGTCEALRLAGLLARALETLHAAGVLHRDLKPGNVMMREDGSLALIDFGLSKDAALALEVTDEGAIFGTPHYMSPEQGHGEAIDVRSDLYSLGVILFEMIAGRKPYNAENPMAIIYKHRKEPIPRLPGEVSALQPVLERLLAKSPADRFTDAGEAAAALELALVRYEAWWRRGSAKERESA